MVEESAEELRRWLYSSSDLPPSYTEWLAHDGEHAARATPHLAFLDHAWGSTPPRVLEAGLKAMARAALWGNATWDTVFGELIPQASGHVLELLGLQPPSPAAPPLARVHWGSNSHELVWRCISCLMDGQAAGEPLVVLTTDTEFYSMTRQLNRLTSQSTPLSHQHQEEGRLEQATVRSGWAPSVNIRVEAVPAEPADTLEQRLVDATLQLAPDVVYVSHITYLTQRTLLPDPSGAIRRVAHALANAREARQQPEEPYADVAAPGQDQQAPASAGGDGATHRREPQAQQAHRVGQGCRHAPLLLMDGYHSFLALPVDLREGYTCPPVASGAVALGYVSGLLKHAACGPNAALLVTSAAWTPRPLWTGWLADVSVLGPESAGIRLATSQERQRRSSSGRGAAGGAKDAVNAEEARAAGVGFTPGLELQGGTPSYVLPLYCFVHLVACLKHGPPGARGEAAPSGMRISVRDIHRHVLRLQRLFVKGLREAETLCGGGEAGTAATLALRPGQLVNYGGAAGGKERPASDSSWAEEEEEEDDEEEEVPRSHTLVFKLASPELAAKAVAHFASQGVAVDARKGHVRVGFGFNHSPEDVRVLLAAVRAGAVAREP